MTEPIRTSAAIDLDDLARRLGAELPLGAGWSLRDVSMVLDERGRTWSVELAFPSPCTREYRYAGGRAFALEYDTTRQVIEGETPDALIATVRRIVDELGLRKLAP